VRTQWLCPTPTWGYVYLVGGFLRLATQFEQDMAEKKVPDKRPSKTAAWSKRKCPSGNRSACDVPNWQQPRGFVTKTALRCSTPIKSRLTIFDGGPPCAAKPLLFTRWDNPLLYAWTAPRQRLSPRRHIGVTYGDSRAPRWADAPVNDGLFVRRVCLTAES